MTTPRSLLRALLPLLLAMVATAQAPDEEGAGTTTEPDATALTSALEREVERPDHAYHLQVDCADDRRVRSLELFPGGTAIWNRRAQFVLPSEQRRELLQILLRGQFAQLAPTYGGRPDPGEPQAALRVTCRIVLELDDLHKSSVQYDEGEQSAELKTLALALLDLAEPFAMEGTRVTDVDEGLRKLAAGALRPEGFTLRFVELPAAGSDADAGWIRRVEGSTISVQRYAPGRTVGDPASRALEPEEWQTLVEALIAADVQELPVNLWSDQQLELEVRVLDQRKSVIARPFSRLEGREADPAQQRFDRLLGALRGLRDAVP